MPQENAIYLNDKRQINIDFAKVLAIIFMIMIHTYMGYLEDFSEGFLYVLNSVLAGPLSAPVFMVSMGVGFAYTKKQEPKNFIKRGLGVLLLGYLLNLFMFPASLQGILSESKEVIIDSVIVNLTYGDIFHFAGLAMILFGLLRLIKLNDIVIMLIGIVLSLAMSFMPVIFTENYFVSSFFGLFLPVEHSSCVYTVFPLFTWFIFPTFGYWFGNKLKNIKKLNLFYLLIGIFSTILGFVGLGLEIHYDFGMMNRIDENGFYFMKTYEAIISICCSLSLYALSFFLVKLFPKKLSDAITRTSDSLNVIYFISWIILTYLAFGIYCFVDEVPVTIVHILSVLCVIVIIPLGIVIKKHLKENPKSIFRFLNP